LTVFFSHKAPGINLNVNGAELLASYLALAAAESIGIAQRPRQSSKNAKQGAS